VKECGKRLLPKAVVLIIDTRRGVLKGDKNEYFHWSGGLLLSSIQTDVN
jgi:hypothetical protein